jgi:sigma-B regulation protein RsbU (phosphoserine phosphatase)
MKRGRKSRHDEPGGPQSPDAGLIERQLEKLRAELDGVREMLACLLPGEIPDIPGHDLVPYYRSAPEAGANWYDFVGREGGRLAISIGEPLASGVPGAMIMAMACTLFRALAPVSGSCAETLRWMNAQLGEQFARGVFVTVLLAELDVGRRVLTVSSAGGCPPLVYRKRARELEEIGEKGIPLGFDEEAFDKELVEVQVQLEPGDRVVMISSGVLRAENSRGEEYGIDRLRRLVKKRARKESEEFIQALVHEIDRHRGDRPQDHDLLALTLGALRE